MHDYHRRDRKSNSGFSDRKTSLGHALRVLDKLSSMEVLKLAYWASLMTKSTQLTLIHEKKLCCVILSHVLVQMVFLS